jgi:hypothetical protein
VTQNTSPGPRDKPDQMPWESEPFEDHQAATRDAIAAAQPDATRHPRDKIKQMAWEPQPFEDHQAAARDAVAAAQWHAPGLLTPVQRKYAEKAFRDEIAILKAQTEGTRNDTLNLAGFKLGQLVGAGALDEHQVRDALYEACRVNQHLQQDGEHMVLGTIESGFEAGLKKPRDLSRVKGNGATYVDGYDEPKTLQLTTVQDIEAGFWVKRESLQTIYLAALARMCSPWAVLAYCVANVLALVRPNTVLPNVIGEGGGSLNWFAAIGARSGGGKGSAASVASYLVDASVQQRNLGSGEGLIDAYVKPVDKETGEPAGMHESIMFVADEIDTMTALASRAGNTMSSTLRSGFSGATIGFSYRSNNRHLRAHTYRMTLVVNVQPAKAGGLLDDQHGGMLQRFMWFPGTDSRVTVPVPEMPLPLGLPPYTDWAFPRTLKIPGRATRLIRQERVKANAEDDEQDFLDGHALFIREKFAYALAVLDGRSEMCEADWDLAGIASRVSDHTRQWVTEKLDKAAKDDAEHKGMLQGVANMAADDEKAYRQALRGIRIRKWICKQLEANPEGFTLGELRRRAQSPDRPFIELNLDRLCHDGVVRCDPTTKLWSLTQS